MNWLLSIALSVGFAFELAFIWKFVDYVREIRDDLKVIRDLIED